MREGLYAGLPKEFSPPDRAAAAIAMLDAGKAREAYFQRIPEGWRAWVAHEAKIAIALRICGMPDKADRQAQLAAPPEAWREDVKWHVLRLWQTRSIRAEYRAELESRAAAERAAGRR
jgi:hypothetical protein